MNKIIDNQIKIEKLAEFGDEYFKMFGEMLIDKKLSIQEAIDEMYDYFYGGCKNE